MGIFDIFKKKTEKNKYQIYYESISEILKLLERRKKIVDGLNDGESILDIDFENKLMIERLTLLDIIDKGSISFLGKDFTLHLHKSFGDEEVKKNDIIRFWNYLIIEQEKLKKLF